MNRIIVPHTALRLWIGAALCVSIASSQDARAVIEESQKRARSTSQKYEGVLQVFDPGGKITEKRWRSERAGAFGNSKSILRFTSPAEVKGVALLVVNHPDRASDQWMWTPNIGRDRRIALQDRSTRFFGTDFSFEDLEERDVDQFTYKLLGEEDIDGARCWHIEARAKQTKASQYSAIALWVRKDNYVTAQFEGLVKDKLARRLRYQQIENVQGVWTARLLELTDVRRGGRTVL
ncbi:MAG: outer membrane lipoprotein-sorting protein, partial [Bryobacterales bacterium]|nr:outer membrane lipoprotein-sorting protein [Bryobacterales bacterium]